MFYRERITKFDKLLTCRDVTYRSPERYCRPPDPAQSPVAERHAFRDREAKRRVSEPRDRTGSRSRERRRRDREERDKDAIRHRGERGRDLQESDSPRGPGLWGDATHRKRGMRIKPWRFWSKTWEPEPMAPLPLVAMRTRLRGSQGNKNPGGHNIRGPGLGGIVRYT